MAKGVTGLGNRVIRIGFDCKQLTRFGALPTSITLKSERIYKNTGVLRKNSYTKDCEFTFICVSRQAHSLNN